MMVNVMKMDKVGDLVRDKDGLLISLVMIVDVDDNDDLIDGNNVKLIGIDEDGDLREGVLIKDRRSGVWLRLWKR